MKLREQQLNWDWNEINAKLDTGSVKDFPGNTEPDTPGTTPGTKISDADFETFKTVLADKLNFQLTDEKHKFLNAWRKAENTNAANNPFATTLNYKNDPGITKFNLANKGQGVKNFSTVEFGADATTKTLNLRYYTNLVSQLRDDAINATQLADNPELNTWGTGRLVAKILNSKKSTDKKISTGDINVEEAFKLIIEYNTIVVEAINDMYNVFTKNPEKYFSKFKGFVNDDESGAAKYAKQAYVNGWLKNNKHPEKSLLRINRKLEEIYYQYTHRKYSSDNSTDYIVAAVVYVQDNIRTLTLMINAISKLIATGKQQNVGGKFYRYYDDKWNEYTVVYKWNYM
jgi:hypothetical protein